MLSRTPAFRYSIAALAGVIATTLIFLLMYRLIGSGPKVVDTATLIAAVNIYQPQPEKTTTPPVEENVPAPKQPSRLEPEMAPLSVNPPAPVATASLAGPPLDSFAPAFDDTLLTSGNGSAFGSGDNTDATTWTPPGDDKLAKKIAAADAKGSEGYKEVLPLSTRQPNVPEYAWNNKIDGWVLVAFTVNARGRVEDVRVLDSKPHGVFDENVIASVKHWIYDPADFRGRKVKAQLTQRIELYWKDYPNNNKQLP